MFAFSSGSGIRKIDAVTLASILAGGGMNIVSDQFPKWIGWALIAIGICVWGNFHLPNFFPRNWAVWKSWTALGSFFAVFAAAFFYLFFFTSHLSFRLSRIALRVQRSAFVE